MKWNQVAKDAKLLTNSDIDCGFCDDCKVIYDYPIIPKKELILIGIDINELNHDMVNKTYELLSHGDTNMSLVSMYLIHAGAAANVGTTKVFKCKFGDELCKLPDENSGETNEMVIIPLVTVESSLHDIINTNKRSHPILHDIMQKVYHNHPINTGLNGNHSEIAAATDIKLIDILLIDVEGFDPLVIQGTRHLLKYRAIRVVRFEYNCVGPWRNVELKIIIQEFDSFDYDCFFEGQERLWYISGKCWHDSWEFKQWSNVMCVNRNDPWIEVARKYLVTKQSLLSSYEGKIIRMRSQKDVYLVENGTKKPFMNADAFLNRGYEWRNIIAVDSGITDILLPTGSPIE